MIHSTNIDSNNFEDFVKTPNLSMIYIKASWCGPCKILSPIIDEIMNEKNGEIILGKVDADSEIDFVKSLNVRNIPTILFYKNGELVDRTTGLKNKIELSKLIDDLKAN
jgi:thioredoxin 1